MSGFADVYTAPPTLAVVIAIAVILIMVGIKEWNG